MKKRNDDFSDSYDDENDGAVADGDDTEESWEDLDKEEEDEEEKIKTTPAHGRSCFYFALIFMNFFFPIFIIEPGCGLKFGSPITFELTSIAPSRISRLYSEFDPTIPAFSKISESLTSSYLTAGILVGSFFS